MAQLIGGMYQTAAQQNLPERLRGLLQPGPGPACQSWPHIGLPISAGMTLTEILTCLKTLDLLLIVPVQQHFPPLQARLPMKRFQLNADPHDENADYVTRVEQALARSDQSDGIQYTLFAPLHYEPNYAYPLLIWLHGPGDDERQVTRILPEISMRNYVGLGLRGPRRHDSGNGFQWTPQDTDLSSAEMGVFRCFDIVCGKYHIAGHRVFLGGYLGAGTLALRLGLKYPNRFAGVLSIGGHFPLGSAPLSHLEQVRELPLFIACGRNSTTYPEERTCRELRLFHAAGMHVTLRQYPCGDEMPTQMLHDVDVWIMEQITGLAHTETHDLSVQ